MEDQCQSRYKSLSIFRDKYVGKRAFIIGNGPSLNKIDLSRLKNEVTFGVNSIFYNFDKMGFKPAFYVVEDSLVVQDRREEINSLTGMVKIFGKYLQKYRIEDKSDVIWANVIMDHLDYPGFPHFSQDAAKCLWVGGTVSYLCMQLAYYMGFDEVYLIGFDHNYIIPSDAKVKGCVITSASDDPNHFHPDYFGKGKRWHDPRLDRMEISYRRAKEAFEQSGRKIYNSTAGGKLEVFERLDYDSLFDKSGGESRSIRMAIRRPQPAQKNTNHQVIRLMQTGVERYIEGELAGARMLFHQALDLAPENPVLLANLGKIAVDMERYESALGYFQVSTLINPENVDHQAWVALLAQKEKQPEAFELACRQIYRLDPTHPMLSKSQTVKLTDDTIKASSPAVSVIIPCHNTAKYLGEAIESVLAQTYPNFEIIVVDDGSTDDTPQVVKSFDDKRIRYVYQENKGLAAARNTGICHSRGQYLTFLDADDTFLPDKLMVQTTFLKNYPEIGLVAGGYLRTDGQGKPFFENRLIEPKILQPEELLVVNVLHVPSTLIRRHWIERAGFFDESLPAAEDWDFHCRLAILDCKMFRTTDVVCTYRYTPGSMSTNAEQQTAAMLRVVEKSFTHRELPLYLADLEAKARGFTHLKGAVRCYSAGLIDKARRHLALALRYHPNLRNDSYEKVIDMLVSWGRDHIKIDSPLVYINSVFDNLPQEAADMQRLKAFTLYRMSQANGFESTSKATHNVPISMDTVNKNKIYETLNKCCFSENCHEKEVLEDLPKILDGVKVFVDVGASLGQYTYFANKYMQGG
jgi:glycosyltransferase involved in cell wall biosynthesis